FMNKSLRIKLTVALMSTVMITLLISIFVNHFFLDDYYIAGKQKTLINVYSKINQMYSTFEVSDREKSDDGSTSESDGYSWFGQNDISDLSEFVDMELAMEQLSQSNNISMLLYRIQNKRTFNQQTVYDMQVLFSSTGNSNTNNHDVENFAIYRDYIQSENRTDILTENERYVLQQVYVNRMNSEYLYLLGNMDNGDHIMLRASIQSIEESAQISNQFFVYVTVCVCAISFIAMLSISQRFTGEILNLAKIARKMSHLDFQEKYEVRTEDEIGILGESINTLSKTLEITLGELKSANVQLKRELEQKMQIDEMRKEF
uniref:HAMP domain-containing protein n=1 Tax=Frisingicoccus sp. TaxID=1918627 RepID=UPI003865CB41